MLKGVLNKRLNRFDVEFLQENAHKSVFMCNCDCSHMRAMVVLKAGGRRGVGLGGGGRRSGRSGCSWLRLRTARGAGAATIPSFGSILRF